MSLEQRLYLIVFVMGVSFMAVTGLANLLLVILVVALILGLFFWGMSYIQMPQPVKSIIYVVAVIVVLLWLVSNLGVLHF